MHLCLFAGTGPSIFASADSRPAVVDTGRVSLFEVLMIGHDELMARLDSVASAITDNVQMVNYGGCAVVAYHVAKTLIGLGFRAEVVTADNWGSAPAVARAALVGQDDWLKRRPMAARWTAAGLSRRHLACRFETDQGLFTFDSDGVVDSGSMFGHAAEYVCNYPFGQGLTVKETWPMVRSKYGWNTVFDRAQIADVKTLVDYHLRMGMPYHG